MSEYLSQVGIREELIAQKEILSGGVPTVIKIGGSIAAEADTTLRDVAFLHREIGVPLIIVHGGGPEINKALEEREIPIQIVDGLRVTDELTLAVVVSVLNGINNQITHALKEFGVSAKGYAAEARLLEAVVEDQHLGYVGAVISVDARSLSVALNEEYIPVITPVGIMKGNAGQYLNINGDTSAGAIAASLGANLILATDVPGVKDVNDIILPQINSDQYEQMYAAGIITRGMVPKVQAGLKAAHEGGRAVICRGADLLYGFTDKPRGTLISK